ncbi:MAG: FAD-dependent monooxygenase [Sneathiella sp.]
MTSKILIVGAGIAGLSLARRLTQFDLDFDIIDEKPSEYKSGAGIALPFNAVRELKDLKVFDSLAGRYHQVKEINYTTTSGKILGTANLTDPPFDQEMYIAMKRQDLHAALSVGLEHKIRHNTKLLSVVHADDQVDVSCSYELLDGKYDLVVAADGIHSTVRSQNYEGQETIRDHQMRCWRFIVTLPEHGLEPLYMMGKTDLFMAYPISANAVYCYGHIHEHSPSADLTDNAADNLRKIFSGYGGPVPEILSKLDEVKIVTGRLLSVTEPRFYDRRIVFVGDAANGCSPLIQQGAAAALEDTNILADALAMQNIDQALESYQARREARIRWVVQYSDGPLPHLLKMESWMGRAIRYLMIKSRGPLNVYGWKKLATDRLLSNS